MAERLPAVTADERLRALQHRLTWGCKAVERHLWAARRWSVQVQVYLARQRALWAIFQGRWRRYDGEVSPADAACGGAGADWHAWEYLVRIDSPAGE
jgi:hypothetical protein